MSGMIHTIFCIAWEVFAFMFIITGGGSGLGRALALALVQRKHSVLIVGRHEERLQDTAKDAPLIDYVCADVSTDVGRATLIEKLAHCSHITGLIHNAGIIDPITPMAQISPSAWRACMATNVEAPLFLTQSLLPLLSHARVLHIGSGAAYFPIKGWSAYCTSKAALAMVTRSWQLDEPDLLIASVMPGIIDTEMQTTIRHAQDMDPEKHAFFCELKANGRLLRSETVAEFLIWLLLDITGAEYVSKEWDVYDTQYHPFWLRPPHVVPHID